MKYFFDTSYIEGFYKPLLGKKRHYLDLVSIGIVAEDGRKYFAISNEYSYHDATEGTRELVIIPMYKEFIRGDQRNRYNASNFHLWLGRSNSQIAKEIIEFINPGITDFIYKYTRHDCWAEEFYPKEFEYIRQHNTRIPEHHWKSGVKGDGYEKNRALIYNQPEFYAYYSDHNWTLLCSLFGRITDKPKGFPGYCIDLNQMMKERGLSRKWQQLACPDPVPGEHFGKAYWAMQLYEEIMKADAEWIRLSNRPAGTDKKSSTPSI